MYGACWPSQVMVSSIGPSVLTATPLRLIVPRLPPPLATRTSEVAIVLVNSPISCVSEQVKSLTSPPVLVTLADADTR